MPVIEEAITTNKTFILGEDGTLFCDYLSLLTKARNYLKFTVISMQRPKKRNHSASSKKLLHHFLVCGSG